MDINYDVIKTYRLSKWRSSNYFNFSYEISKAKNLESNTDKLIVSWNAYMDMIDGICDNIDTVIIRQGYKNDCRIFGVVRGGLPIMTHISNKLKMSYGIIDYQTRDGNSVKPKILTGDFKEEMVILVDDIIDTGRTINTILSMDEMKNKQIFVYSLFKYLDVELPRYVYTFSCVHFERGNIWVVFPWEN